MTTIEKVADQLQDLKLWMKEIEKEDENGVPLINASQFRREVQDILKTIEQENTTIEVAGKTSLRLHEISRELSRGTWDYDWPEETYNIDDVLNYLIDKLENEWSEDTTLIKQMIEHSTEFWKYMIHDVTVLKDEEMKDFYLHEYSERLKERFTYPPKHKEGYY